MDATDPRTTPPVRPAPDADPRTGASAGPTPAAALRPDVCIVGGGPAGMIAGLLLARRGLAVTVLEKHADFHRDFRGDTIHPSTLELLRELGLLDEFLALPHDETRGIGVAFGSRRYVLADFSRLPTCSRFVAFVPQWDFLDVLARAAHELPGFHLLRRTGMRELLIEDGTVVGVRADAPDGPLEIRARLVIGADGRHSRVREAAALPLRSSGAPLDVLWMRLPRHEGEQLPLFNGGVGALICLDRGDYWQIALAVPKGTIDALRARGEETLRARIAASRPELAARAATLTWEDIHPLEVRVDHLRRWHRPGLLCLGDAAHAMSPAGGVGINLAVQDAVAAARLLGPILATRTPTPAELDAVRRRRLPPARLTQRIQDRVLGAALPRTLDEVRTRPPLLVRVLAAVPPARHLMGRAIGLGARPEHLG